jgi:hypothetical protein
MFVVGFFSSYLGSVVLTYVLLALSSVIFFSGSVMVSFFGSVVVFFSGSFGSSGLVSLTGYLSSTAGFVSFLVSFFVSLAGFSSTSLVVSVVFLS